MYAVKLLIMTDFLRLYKLEYFFFETYNIL